MEKTGTGKVAELVSLLRRYKEAYYNGEPLVEDMVYDALEDDLRRLDPDHPFLSEVGAPVPEGKMKWEKVSHLMPMSSLNKVNSISGIRQWYASLNAGNTLLSWSEKLDGISICLNYEGGTLKSAITRGDGQVGEDIMANVVLMRGVIRELSQPLTGSVRGEIILTHDMWREHFPEFSNPRNAASGISKRESRDKAQDCQYLTIKCYDLQTSQVPLRNEEEKFFFLKSLGFQTPNYGVGRTPDELNTLYDEYTASLREELNYDIDGLVIRLEDLSAFERAGERGGNPHGAVALKFAAEGAVTVLEAVEWQVGNTGRITPVAIFEPVNLVGAEVGRASLYNYAYIQELNLHLTDEILVVRANDVIPRVEKVVSSLGEASDPRHGCIIEAPSKCPECSNPTAWEGEYLVCTGGVECPANKAGLIKQWISELDIKDWGDFIVEELVAQGLVNDIPDLYRLKHQDIATLRNSNDAVVGNSTATKLLRQLREGSTTTLPTIIGGLGIPGIRTSSAQKIVNAGYGAISEITRLTEAQVVSIPSFGHKKAQAFVHGIKVRKNVLEELVLNRYVEIEKSTTSASGSLRGKKVVLTGSMTKTRDVIKRDIKAAGGSVSSSVSGSTDYLVAADLYSTTSKANDARKRNIPIITEKELYDMM